MAHNKDDSTYFPSLLQQQSPDYKFSSTGSVHLTNASSKRNLRTVLDFESIHRKSDQTRSTKRAVRACLASKWSKFSIKRLAVKNFPLLKTLRSYSVSRDLLNDAVAGLTVGVMVIPQAMAFALVASLPPIVGLYIALFSSLTYCLMGTGHHLSWNCVAVLAIMMGALLDKYDGSIRRSLRHQFLQVESVRTGADVDVAVERLLPLSAISTNTATSRTHHLTADSASPSPHWPSTDDSGDTVEARTLPKHGQVFSEVTEAFAMSAVSRYMKTPAVQHAIVENSGDEVKRLNNVNQSSDISDSGDQQKDGANGNGSVLSPNSTSSPKHQQQEMEALVTRKKIELASAVTLLSGLILTVLGKLGFGRIASLLSDSLVISFTVGVSFHVVVGQLVTAFGLHLPARSGAFKIFKLSADIVANIHRSNPATVVVFVVCCLILYCVKRFVNEKYHAKLKVPVPIELVVVIVATAINTWLKMNESFSVDIVKDIPLGVPRPTLPNMVVGLDYLTDGLMIIMVSFTQTVALGKIMALKNNYTIDCNQEMFALGVASILCSFFSGFFPGASITCTVVQEAAGGRTQIASIFSSGLVFLVIMFLGPYFYFLPQSVLAAIIVINIRSMFFKLLTVPALWRKSRGDAIVWIATCFSTVVLDTDLGLVVGLTVCVLGVLVRSRLAPVDILGHVSADNSFVWKSIEKYNNALQLCGVKVLRVNCDFYFVNADCIYDEIVTKSGIDPLSLVNEGRRVSVPYPTNPSVSDSKACYGRPGSPEESQTKTDKSENEMTSLYETLSDSLQSSSRAKEEKSLDYETTYTSHIDRICSSSYEDVKSMSPCMPSPRGHPEQRLCTTLVLDFAATSFLDITAVETLERVMAEFEAVGITVYLAQLQESCVKTLMETGFLQKHCDRVFISVDAVLDFLGTA